MTVLVYFAFFGCFGLLCNGIFNPEVSPKMDIDNIVKPVFGNVALSHAEALIESLSLYVFETLTAKARKIEGEGSDSLGVSL